VPISFAEPAPAGAFNDIARQGNLPAYLSAYSSMSNALQSRYASDLHSQNQAALGYAGLAQDAALKREALGLQAAEIAQRPGLQEAAIQMRARAEMDQWLGQQQFTARDQMELNRQRNVLGELMAKRDSGEIDDHEFYTQAGAAAPRINSLQERERFTQNQALAEQKKAMADNYHSQMEMRDNALSFQRAEMDGKLGTYVPPKYKMQLSQMMTDAHPELQQGTPEWDAMSTMMADEMGWSERYTKNAKGEMVFEKQVRGQGSSGASGADGSAGSGSGKPMTERDTNSLAEKALHAASSYFEKLGKEPSEEELMSEATKRMNIISKLAGGLSGSGEKVKAQQVHESAVNGLEQTVQELSGAPGAQKFVQKILDLTKKYPPSKRPSAIQKKIDDMTAQYKMFEQMRAQQQQPAQQQGAEPAAPGQAPLQWGQSFGRDVGNAGRLVGRNARDAAAAVQDAVVNAPGRALPAAQHLFSGPESPIPDSWGKYLFGE
jgi:hypothetical protein